MTKLMITALILASTTAANADAKFMPNLLVKGIVSFSGDVYHITFDKSMTDTTCNHWGFNFRITENDNRIKDLKLAAVLKKPVFIGYMTSTAPGTTHDSGCTINTMAKILYVGTQY